MITGNNPLRRAARSLRANPLMTATLGFSLQINSLRAKASVLRSRLPVRAPHGSSRLHKFAIHTRNQMHQGAQYIIG